MVRIGCATLVVALIAGCGSKPAEDTTLTFDKLDARDTTGLTRGRPLLHTLEIQRDPAGALVARGRLDLPEGTQLDLIVYAVRGSEVLGRTQFSVRGGGFESPPILGAGGRLPEGLYHFQLRGRFDPAVQPPEVMTALSGRHRPRGPGMMRTPDGGLAFVHDVELRR